MAQRTTTALAAALTLVGGHFLNRRWERAALFFALYVLWFFSANLLWRFVMPQGWTGGEFDMSAFAASARRMGLIYGAGFLTIWVASLATTLRDYPQRPASDPVRWRAGQRIGAGSLTLAAGLLVAVSVAWTGAYLRWDSAAAMSAKIESRTKDLGRGGSWFWANVHFGGLAGPSDDFPPPPPGSGYLTGQALYDGKPAPGVTLRVTLNGEFTTKDIVTDAAGAFSIRLAPGQWWVNAVTVTRWKNKPRGRFLLTSGHENRLEGESFSRYLSMPDGLEVTVSEPQPSPPHIVLTIRPRIEMTWPKRARGIARSPIEQDRLEGIRRRRGLPRRAAGNGALYQRRALLSHAFKTNRERDRAAPLDAAGGRGGGRSQGIPGDRVRVRPGGKLPE